MTTYALVPGACHGGWWTEVPSKTYVAATKWSGGLAASPFAATAQRVAAVPAWSYLE